ncbi:DNA/RNA non-specific endonuclease [Maribacter sp. 2304DJ31-5]|uniref:DNA/RNA non-specific endonuclease n=1 Tax=Maribacter sp. 2304DJ31-5 TaxID=3386273 RepID=UPI0039BD16F0
MGNYKKDRAIYTGMILICVLSFWVFENFYTPSIYSDNTESNKESTFPETFLPFSTTGEVVHHSHYSLSYNEPFEQAEWVAYILKREHLTYDDRKRPYFIEDPWVKTKSADWRNYKGSGYDRGHLCPAGDRRFSEQAYNETFYTSNISPQNRDFNAGIWNRLEAQIRSWTRRYGELYVITGGVLEKGLDEIGEEGVDVPKYFYKIVAKGDKEDLEVIGFLMAGREKASPLKTFTVPLDKIEELTGIDFFYRLDKKRQEEFESKNSLENWKF